MKLLALKLATLANTVHGHNSFFPIQTICCLANKPYLTFSDLIELKKELRSLGYLFDQLDAEKYIVINLMKLQNKKPIKLTQADFEKLNKEDVNSLITQLAQQNKTEPDHFDKIELKKDEFLFDLWNALIQQVKTHSPSITYIALAHQLKLLKEKPHLTVLKRLKDIHRFCEKQHIPDLALLASSEKTGIPSEFFLDKEVQGRDTGVILTWVRAQLQSVFAYDYTAAGEAFLAEITEIDTTGDEDNH